MTHRWNDVEDEVELLLRVKIKRSGSYTPARLGGPPEDAEPEDYEDERVVTDVEIGRTTIARELFEGAAHAGSIVLEKIEEAVDELDLDPPEE